MSPAAAISGNPAPTATAPESLTPNAEGAWLPAGTLVDGRLGPKVALTSDNRVLVVGNDRDCDYTAGAFGDTAAAEISIDWAAATDEFGPRDPLRWRDTASLSAPRADFVGVSLPDGRMLVAGGVDGGKGHAMYTFQSYSSAWIYDTETSSWQRAGLMNQARTDPSVAVLHDGRVLVAGGIYETVVDAPMGARAPLLLGNLGSLPAGGLLGLGFGMLADIGPHPAQPAVPVLATAEVYDPAKDRWSVTGSLRYPRYGAPAVTLTDGRVLIVGRSVSQELGRWGRSGGVASDPEASSTAELYDPRTGRFGLTGRLPAPVISGSLVALPDGGALLLGWGSGGFDGKPQGLPASTPLRFNAATGRWSVVTDPSAPVRGNVVAARLSDGRILVAGGEDRAGPTNKAELYDPASDRWSQLAPMPEPRAGGAAVLGADGAVLIVGGYGSGNNYPFGGELECPVGLNSALWFVPGTP